jgi:hypothetical protein
MKRRGSSLFLVLTFVGVLTLLLFTMAQMCIFHLQFSVETDTRQLARDLAESVVNEGLARAANDNGFGTAAPPPTLVIPGSISGSTGTLSFDTHQSQVPASINNLINAGAAHSSTGLPVPGNTIYLVGKGQVGTVQATLETLYYIPPFPKALATSGPINATDTNVMGMPFNTTYPGTPAMLLALGLNRPGSMITNDNGATAINLVNCSISGDVGAVGQVVLDAATNVSGEIRSNQAPQAVPHLDVANLIANVNTVGGTSMLAGAVGSQNVTWFAGCNGNLLINGDLTLSDGVLWVNGDLTVTGGINGTGMILCSGNAQLQQGTQFNAQNSVALAAKGNVVLNGLNQSNYFFQGLIYTNGNFRADSLTVLGTVVCDGSGPGTGAMNLTNANMVGQAVPAPAISLPWYFQKSNNTMNTTQTGRDYGFLFVIRPDSPIFIPGTQWGNASPLKIEDTDMTLMNLTTGQSQTWLRLGWDAAVNNSWVQQIFWENQNGVPAIPFAQRYKAGLKHAIDCSTYGDLSRPPQNTWFDVSANPDLYLLPVINNLVPSTDTIRILLWHFD